MMAHKSLYEMLGIERTASDSELFAAFEKHYTNYGEAMPRALMRAYQTLRDSEKRALYDWVLDQYHSGFPVEVPSDRLAAFQQCCKDFGFELTRHPMRRDTYELSIPAHRPPGIDALPATPKSDSMAAAQSGDQADRQPPPSPPPPPTTHVQSPDPQPVNWWPARPLVLGSRIYHWAYFRYRVQLVVSTTRTTEVHVTGVGNGQPLVINSPILAGFDVQDGDMLGVFGLGELSIEQFWYFSPFVNKTRGKWALLDGWENTIPWRQAASYFGVPRKRHEIHDIVSRYLRAACELALRELGCSDAVVAAGVEQNVQRCLHTRFRMPWFHLPG